jgi:hypothetical protein
MSWAEWFAFIDRRFFGGPLPAFWKVGFERKEKNHPFPKGMIDAAWDFPVK